MSLSLDWTVFNNALVWGVRYQGNIVTAFHCKSLPFTCATEELGMFFYDPNTPKELAKECINKFLDSRKGFTAGATLVHFAKPSYSSTYGSYQWIELFKEAGFKQVIPEYENHVHPGTMITQLVYVHNREKK